MSLARWQYQSPFFFCNDFIGPLETYDVHFITSAPQEIQNYLTLITVFDAQIWAFLIVSIVAVIIAVLTINMICNTWHEDSAKEETYQSKVVAENLTCTYQY